MHLHHAEVFSRGYRFHGAAGSSLMRPSLPTRPSSPEENKVKPEVPCMGHGVTPSWLGLLTLLVWGWRVVNWGERGQ